MLSSTQLASSLMYKINNLAVASPTSLVVAVLLTHPGRGIGRHELVEKVKWLRKVRTPFGLFLVLLLLGSVAA